MMTRFLAVALAAALLPTVVCAEGMKIGVAWGDFQEERWRWDAAAMRSSIEKNGNDFGRFNYLGEWHSHPSFPVSPSTTDIRTMQAMVEDVGNIDFSVLMIVRLRMFVMLQVGTYLFMRGQPPQRVEMVDEPVSRSKRTFI